MEKINKIRFKFNKIYYSLFKERFDKSINFDFPEGINRWDLIRKVIKTHNFKSYLEIGCDDDYSFKKINVPEKIGVDPYSGGNFKGTSDQFFSKNNRKSIIALKEKLISSLIKKITNKNIKRITGC